jgi:peptidoglycan/xylan/chitin deacetylase (PgdA/CDA1 family)
VLALVLLVVLLFAVLGGGGGVGDGKLHLSAESRAALKNVEPVRQGLDRLLLGAPLPSTAEQQAAVGRLTQLGLPVFCAGTQNKYVALTFDDGPGPYTRQLLDLLGRNNARATFFLLGVYVARRPWLARRELRYGTAGTHSWDHPKLTELSPDQLQFQLREPKMVLQRVLRREVRLFRPPFGAHNEAIDAGVQALNMLQVLWNVDSGDASEASTPSADVIAQQLKDRIRPGAIVLMHENIMGAPSITALETVLPALRARGLIPVTVPELLVLDPPTDEQVSKGSGGCHSAWQPGKS